MPAEASSIQCAVRCPDGSRCSIKLRRSDPLAALFWLVDAQASIPAGVEFALVTSFPRRRFLRPARPSASRAQLQPQPQAEAQPQEESTMESAGLVDSSQQAFFVELLR